MKDDKKVFVIVNSYFIGDILLTNSLVQNIKRLYKNSAVVMLTSPQLFDLAKYQEGVDDVIVWDRHGIHKGFCNMIKFILNFPYKNIYAAIPIYGMDRPVLLSRLLFPKYVLTHKNRFYSKFLRNSKFKIDSSEFNAQKRMLAVLGGVTKEALLDCPIKFNLPQMDNIDLPRKYITLVPTTSRIDKDIPLETIIDILTKCSDKTFVMLGHGNSVKNISESIVKYNFPNFIDMSNKTSILEASNIISKGMFTIAADTGLMHMSCALNKPTLALFYEGSNKNYIPDKTLYDVQVLKDNITSQKIVELIEQLINRTKG